MAQTAKYVTAMGQVWWHYLHLDRVDTETADRSMTALRTLGEASLPALRRGIRQGNAPRLQFRCAVVLHWLGGLEGLPVLIDALRYGAGKRKGPSYDVNKIIAECFVKIGKPDASRALIDLWRQLPGLNDGHPTAILICSIWRTLRDPIVLEAMCDTAEQTPWLLLDSIADFRTDSVPYLSRLARDRDPARRAIAIRSLEKVPGYLSFQAIAPMLRDDEPAVRSLAAGALESVSGPVTTLNALVEAHRAGYSSEASVKLLVLYSPPDLFELLAGLLTRFSPEVSWDAHGVKRATNGDSSEGVREAVLAFGKCVWPHAQVTQLLCSVASRNVPYRIKSAAAIVIAERGPAGDDSDILAYKAMWRQLTVVDVEARESAAAALARLGESTGRSFTGFLDTCRPQANLLRKLQAALLNSQDVSQAMTEAVQHVTSWFSQISRVTAERFTPGSTPGGSGEAILKDTRLPALLRGLLNNVLESLEREEPDAATVEAMSIGVAALRALSKLEPEAALTARPEVCRAFETVKFVSAEGAIKGALAEDVAGVLRDAAGQTLIDMERGRCFETLAAGLEHSLDPVRVSSATALGRLGDPRATPLLQAASEGGTSALAGAAREAIAAIRRGNPEMMTLLRGSSSANARTETLLRPSTDLGDTMSPDLLLRPVQPGQSDQ